MYYAKYTMLRYTTPCAKLVWFPSRAEPSRAIRANTTAAGQNLQVVTGTGKAPNREGMSHPADRKPLLTRSETERRIGQAGPSTQRTAEPESEGGRRARPKGRAHRERATE